MAKLPTIQEMAKDVADRALEEIQVNDMHLSDFIKRVDKVAEMVAYEYNHTENPVMKKFCSEIFSTLNISLDEVTK
jgi:hypothetical protein